MDWFLYDNGLRYERVNEMLLRCCLIHVSIIIVRHVLYLLYLCSCLDLGLFMSCLCSIFDFHLHVNYDLSYNLMNAYLSFAHFLGYVLLLFYYNVDKECE